MAHWLLPTLLGFAGGALNLLAARQGFLLKRDANPWPLVAFWCAAGTYSLGFGLLRLLWGMGVDPLAAYYIQTIGGALSVAALMHIMVSIVGGERAGKVASLAFLGVAVVILALIFGGGVLGPRTTTWSIEYLPQLAFVRGAVGLVYVVVPVGMSMVLLRASRDSQGAFRRRARMFAASVVMLYIPGAIKYVWFVEGAASNALAVVYAVGSGLGWLSYRES